MMHMMHSGNAPFSFLWVYTEVRANLLLYISSIRILIKKSNKEAYF